MPDRVTNTINLPSGDKIFRPTVINCFESQLDSLESWWKTWKGFMFEAKIDVKAKAKNEKTEKKRVAELLSPINRFKYPALTEAESRMSLPLQTIVLAIFDSLMLHMMLQVAPTVWQPLRTDVCAKLNRNKVPRVLEILKTRYGTSDIIFIQEAASSFVRHATKDEHIGAEYHVVTPAKMDSKRDQNSLIFLRRRSFQFHQLREVTGIVKEELESSSVSNVPISDGDVFALRAVDNLGRSYILGSFHGDTNGMATVPVLEAIHKTVQKITQRRSRHRLIFGLDANVYERGSRKRQGVDEFVKVYKSMEMRSCWGLEPMGNNYTTYNARTYLQPQLNKASKKSEFAEKGDRNPKDFILYYNSDFREIETVKDNTGERHYIENMVFPTLNFPSDHAVLSTRLKILMDDDRVESAD
uniref:Endonuclease/exonuclease/phosphatase domain-containing protein n=1 Tax=Norrisiella sphaerica TaxID=552664 RepID=A0A7S2VV40_9EUKA|mmetsp:Transcript_249/g.334  ORF Transcript_249/g.334 Transcript_249/m.334 type:complete len:413 (+) Transcript_249:349-1587(+)